MNFEWDPDKARANLAKHGVSFELARRVWSDPLHQIVPDRIEDGEVRWHALGLVGAVMMFVVVHSYPDSDDTIRIVSARKATKHERRRYERETL